MNGYFQLLFKDEGTFLRVYPHTEKGLPINVNEVMEYLSSRKVAFDAQVLNVGLFKLSQQKDIQLSTEVRVDPEPEGVLLNVSDDQMKAMVRFYPPSVGGAFMGEQDIADVLQGKGIEAGIKRDMIKKFTQVRCYCTTLTIAEGQPVKEGTSAWVEYFFNTDTKIRPKLNEDGSVNFKELNVVNQCKQGDILARLHKEVPGESGITVKGSRIKPAEVRKGILKYGKNISLDEEGMVLASEVSGHVQLIDGKVFVTDVYTVQDVDNSTGNIDYEGSLSIEGSVLSGFSVRVSGNVTVNGVVEAAVIEAGGNITIARGIKGAGKCLVKSGGNVVAKFIESANVEAKGYVQSEAILQSHVLAGTEVNVSGKRGVITGGVVCATNAVNVKNLGSAMGMDTTIEVGLPPGSKARALAMQGEIVQLKKDIDSIRMVLEASLQKTSQGIQLPADKLKSIQALAATGKEKQGRLEVLKKELTLLDEQMALEQPGMV